MAKLKASSILEVLIAMSIIVVSLVLVIRIMVNVGSSTLGWKEVNDNLKSRRVVDPFFEAEGCFHQLPFKGRLVEENISDGSNLVSVLSADSTVLYQKVDFYEE